MTQTNMIQRSRIPAIITLAALMGFGGVMIFAGRPSNDAAELAQLQMAIAQPNASPAAWLRYGQKLQSMGRYAQAAMAYSRCLDGDPTNAGALRQGALCKAQVGDHDDFFAFMQMTVKRDPRLAKDVLERPDVARYLAEARFQDLQKEAVAGSMD